MKGCLLMKIINYENIFPLDGLSCHASHFTLLPDGSVYAVWFRGTAEGNDDVCIFGALKRPGERDWTTPVRLSPDDGQPHWNPVLHKKSDGSVLLFYKAGKPISDWHTELMVSRDNCTSFTGPEELVPGDHSGGRGPVRNKIITLCDGTLLAGGSTEAGVWRCFADRSSDGGKTWSRSADISLSYEQLSHRKKLEGYGIIQPTLWESAPGQVHMLMRSTEEKIFRSDSNDSGKSWGAPYDTGLINNNSGIDLDRTETGRLYLVLNPCGNGSKKFGPRTPLSLFSSDDNGRTFTHVTDIATGAGTFAYPAVRWRDGRLHVTYTWNRKLINYVCLEI